MTAAPATTAPRSATTPPIDSRIVVINADGASDPLIVYDESGNNNNNNNAGLLLLLGLLPILGALGRNGVGAPAPGPVPITGPVPAIGGPLPPLNPVGFWNSQPLLSEFSLGNNIGYGQFGGSYGSNYGNKGNSYNNKNSNYGNNMRSNSYGNNMALSSAPARNTLGQFPRRTFRNNNFGNIQNMNNVNNFASQTGWGNRFFVQKREGVVRNRIRRQAINNPGFTNSNGIQGQQNSYSSKQAHQYPTNWQTQQSGQSEYANSQMTHIHSYNKNQPAQSTLQLQNNGWNAANTNNWNINNGWTQTNTNSGLNKANTNTLSNLNTGMSKANNNGWQNTNINSWNTISNNLNNLNGEWASNNRFNNNLNGQTGTSTWNNRGRQDRTRINRVNQQTRQSLNQRSPQSAWQWPGIQPQVHELYYQLLGGFGDTQLLDQVSNDQLGRPGPASTRSL